jgi:hypothetical protein
MSIELVLWGVLAAIAGVGGLLGIAAIWSLVKAPKQ